jgi:protein arginine N-methyltransferase 1
VFVAAAEHAVQRDDWDLFKKPIVGFDLSLLRDATLSQMYAHEIAPEALISEPVLLEHVELGDDTPSKRRRSATLTLTRAGTLTQIVQWFELDLGAGVTLSTSPSAPLTHWRQIHYPLRDPMRVKKGSMVTVEVALDTRVERPLSISWKVALAPQ